MTSSARALKIVETIVKRTLPVSAMFAFILCVAISATSAIAGTLTNIDMSLCSDTVCYNITSVKAFNGEWHSMIAIPEGQIRVIPKNQVLFSKPYKVYSGKDILIDLDSRFISMDQVDDSEKPGLFIDLKAKKVYNL